MNLTGAFARSVERQPSKIALFWGESEHSYAQLWRQALVVAEQLRQQYGVRPGDRVGLWLKNCPEFVIALFGILHTGAAAVPINNFFKAEEVNYILGDAGIDVLITDAELAAHRPALEAARPGLKLFRVEQLDALAALLDQSVDGSLPAAAHADDFDLGKVVDIGRLCLGATGHCSNSFDD